MVWIGAPPSSAIDTKNNYSLLKRIHGRHVLVFLEWYHPIPTFVPPLQTGNEAQ